MNGAMTVIAGAIPLHKRPCELNNNSLVGCFTNLLRKVYTGIIVGSKLLLTLIYTINS